MVLKGSILGTGARMVLIPIVPPYCLIFIIIFLYFYVARIKISLTIQQVSESWNGACVKRLASHNQISHKTCMKCMHLMLKGHSLLIKKFRSFVECTATLFIIHSASTIRFLLIHLCVCLYACWSDKIHIYCTSHCSWWAAESPAKVTVLCLVWCNILTCQYPHKELCVCTICKPLVCNSLVQIVRLTVESC